MKERPPCALGTAWALGIAALVVLWWTIELFVPREITMASMDLRVFYLPLYEAFYGRVANGRLPLWNPHQLCGLPWVATLQGGFFYPPHVLYVVLPVGVALALSGLVHLLLLAVSSAAFARAVGISPQAAGLAALLFALSGDVPRSLFWPPQLEASAWLPVGSLAVLRIARGDGRRGLLLLALATGASLLAGFPQTTTFLGYAWTTLLLALLLGTRAGPKRWVFAAASFGAGLALGSLVGAVALLPGLEMTRVATRATHTMTVEKMFPFGSAGFGLIRNFFGGPSSSFAVVALSLVPAALLAGRTRTVALWAALLGGLALCFALGPATPLFWLYLALPALSMFRHPHRILILTQFSVALLAAMGLDVIAAASRRPRGTRDLAAVGASIACALVLGTYLVRQGNFHAAFGIGTAAVILSGVWNGRVVRTLVAAIALVELLLVSPRSQRLPYGPAAIGVYRTYQQTYATLAATQGSGRVWIVTGPLELAELSPKLAGVYGVRGITDYDSMILRRQAEYFTYAMEGSIVPHDARAFYVGRLIASPPRDGVSPLAKRRRLLDLAALRLIALHSNLLRRPEMAAFIADAGLIARARDGARLMLFENPNALPRAFVVYRTRPAPPPEELLRQLSEPTFDPLVESFVEGDPGFVAAADAAARGEAATFVRDDAELVEVDATLTAPGLLVLADSFYPGWRATVDGVAAPILATNHLFRGVPVPAGRHRVRFEYAPVSVRAGLLTSSLAAIALAGAFLWAHAHDRRRREQGVAT